MNCKPSFQDAQIMICDESTADKEFMVHVQVSCKDKTYSVLSEGTKCERYKLAMDSKEELQQWWDGLQQHMLDQGE